MKSDFCVVVSAQKFVLRVACSEFPSSVNFADLLQHSFAEYTLCKCQSKCTAKVTVR